ncbi:MAG: carboxypeptidase regulatory-like domain-containing protein [Methanosarcinales archaeon]|nr:carboxypeptidase regulatory-like domain-containing protein [Methanosarcinales archaeon]
MKSPEDLHFKRIGESYGSSIPAEQIKRQGFIGLYHPFKGLVYAGSGVREDDDLYSAYLFGENAILSRPEYGNYRFNENIERHCVEFDINRVHGMVVPPSEGGVVNNPRDDNLLEPASPPGMIQGAHRYSELSKLFPQVTGMIIDDFWANYRGSIGYEGLKNIKGALLGKSVDSSGNVDHSSPATTPHLKLFVVTYEREIVHPDANALELIDGVNLWIYNQEGHYREFDRYMGEIKSNYPGKEIIPGIYIHNSDYGDMSRECITYLLQKSIDLYDEGYVSGILLFAGHWLVKDYISRERSQQISLPEILNQLYYPHLGEVRGRVLDGSTGKPVEKAFIKITSTGRSAGFERAATQKFTNAAGGFRFSGWGGRDGTAVRYSITAQKSGYQPYSGSFDLKVNQTASLPDLALKPQAVGMEVGARPSGSSSVETGTDALAAVIQRTYLGEDEGLIGDLMFPYCIAVPLTRSHEWSYTEAQILSVLQSAKRQRKSYALWDEDDAALYALNFLKEKLAGCPCGLAIGYGASMEKESTVIIYWTDPCNWKFWNPAARSTVRFSCRYVVA